MNSIHNNGENDKSLKDGLDKLSHAYGKLEQDGPPELLDMAILNSAHRAVEKKPRWMKFGWLHGLATAAVFVLAFSLVLDQREHAPVFEDGMRSTQPALLQKEEPAKKQSGDVRAEFRKEMKSRDDKRDGAYESMPLATAPESEAKAGQSRNQAIESQLSNYAQDALQAKAEPADRDMEADKLILEEVSLDEAGFMADAAEPGEANRQAAPAAVAAPMSRSREAEVRAGEYSQPEAEQELLAIIKLKQTGDPGWEAQLESFMESYPNYPLPEELRNP